MCGLTHARPACVLVQPLELADMDEVCLYVCVSRRILNYVVITMHNEFLRMLFVCAYVCARVCEHACVCVRVCV